METQDCLAHYGVMGMKWGVRKDQRRLGTASRIAAKRKHIEGKIAKTGDEGILRRNIVNDYRRGRVAGLKVKEAHRSAKEAYLKNKSDANKKALNDARKDRLVKNVASRNIVDISSRGAYNRYRNSGSKTADAVLKTAGHALVVGAATSAAVTIGQAALTSAGVAATMRALR